MSGAVSAWRIAVDTPDYTADDTAGAGAKAIGGRWNRRGHAVVYASSSIALACLETVVHLKTGGLPLNRYLVKLEIPREAWARRIEHDASSLPVGWDALPEGRVSLDAGDAWLAQSASPVMVVPSAIVPEETNILVNPVHPLSRAVKVAKVRRWHYDPRLLGLSTA